MTLIREEYNIIGIKTEELLLPNGLNQFRIPAHKVDMKEMGDWHEYLIERLTNPEKARSYLNVSLEEYQVDGDLPFFLVGLRNVVEAHGGVPTLAKRIGIVPEELSEILSGEAVPRFDTFISILTALGYRLSIAPLVPADSSIEAADAEPSIPRLGRSVPGTKVAPTEHQ